MTVLVLALLPVAPLVYLIIAGIIAAERADRQEGDE